MPHQCTECGHTFPDGSTDMLSGCPDCGGNKFQYFPGEVPDTPTDEEPPEPTDAGVSGTVGKAARTVRDFVGTDQPQQVSDSGTQQPDQTRTTDTPPTISEDPSPQTEDPSNSEASGAGEDEPTNAFEDDAQRAARSEVVDTTDLPSQTAGDVVQSPNEEQPDMAELREELNDQFESIKIVEPGQYELNLMELYDREEYIIALQENGRYVIEVPDAWHGDE